jgi:branched-subunit amino acid transport protein AzlD
MNYTTTQLILFFVIVALGTFFTRALPFILFPENIPIPRFMKYLADILPYTIIGLLVVYCLKDINLTQSPQAIPEAISIVVIILLHIWKKNTLLSIGGGALLYMILIQSVFV